MPDPYNPLDKLKIADNIVRELFAQPVQSLPDPLLRGPAANAQRFEGAGIYALFYTGSFVAYERIASANRQDLVVPLYVGKADPEGGRTGALELDASQGTPLYRRLLDHAKSIQQANNLDLSDFRCRYLVVDAVWISLGERRLISQHLPVWNTLLDGFGNHDPGGRRAAQFRSPWDTVHPGRRWAARLASHPRTAEEIIADLLAPHSYEELEQRAAQHVKEEDGNVLPDASG